MHSTQLRLSVNCSNITQASEEKQIQASESVNMKPVKKVLDHCRELLQPPQLCNTTGPAGIGKNKQSCVAHPSYTFAHSKCSALQPPVVLMSICTGLTVVWVAYLSRVAVHGAACCLLALTLSRAALVAVVGAACS